MNNELHLQVRYVPSQDAYHWEIGHQVQGALAFDLTPPAYLKIVEYLKFALKNKPETSLPDQLMCVVYQQNTFQWQIGPQEGGLLFVLDSANFNQVVEYLVEKSARNTQYACVDNPTDY